MKKIILALASLVCSVSAHGVQINGNQISSNTAISVSSITLFNGGVLVTTGSVATPTLTASTAAMNFAAISTATVSSATIKNASFSGFVAFSSGALMGASGPYVTSITSANIAGLVGGTAIVSTVTVSKSLNIGLVVSKNSCAGVVAYNGCAPGLKVLSGGCECDGAVEVLYESAPGMNTGNNCSGYTPASSGQGIGWGCSCSVGVTTTHAWSICARVGAN